MYLARSCNRLPQLPPHHSHPFICCRAPRLHLHLRGPLELQAQQRDLGGVPKDEGLQLLLVHLAVRAPDDGLHGGLGTGGGWEGGWECLARQHGKWWDGHKRRRIGTQRAKVHIWRCQPAPHTASAAAHGLPDRPSPAAAAPSPAHLHALHQALQPDLDIALGLHRRLKRHALALPAEHLQHLGAVGLRTWEGGTEEWRLVRVSTALQRVTGGLFSSDSARRASCAAIIGYRAAANFVRPPRIPPPATQAARALSKVTLDSESKRPDWKWGTTAGGSEPSDRISSSVGSDTK